MTKPLNVKLSGRAGRRIALATTALPLLLLMTPLAFAATPTAPAAGSLPGAFTTNTTGTTYTGTGSTATITLGSVTTDTGQVIQFGGHALTNAVSPTTGTTTTALASATNPGFSVGSGASLTVAGGAALPTLINDESGNPSQVYGAVNAAGLGGPLFVANANGVIVGATGVITAPTDGVGLIGYGVGSNNFAANGTLTVDSATVTSNGAMTIANGATVPTSLLVAGAGAVNIGAGSPEVLAGYGFATAATTLTSTATPTAIGGSTASVTFTGGSSTAPLSVGTVYDAGALTNTGVVTFPSNPIVGGTFTNNGVATVSNALSVASLVNAGKLTLTAGSVTTTGASGATTGADITNTGLIDSTSSTAVFLAGSGTAGAATGNFTNSGVIAFTTGAATGVNSLTVDAANINFGGSVQQTLLPATTPTALSATNALASFTLDASYIPSGTVHVPGVVDIASTVYSPFTVSGQAVRIMSGGLIDPTTATTDTINVGTGIATDPFFSNAKLAYNLSLFGGTTVSAPTVNVLGSFEPATGSTALSNLNINGTLGSSTTTVINLGATGSNLGNINGDATGGLSVADSGAVNAYFSGNINNPYGMAQAGQTSYLYNSLPVTVANNTTTGKAGTVALSFFGPSSKGGGTAQNVNLMVLGNAKLVSRAPTTTGPTTTTPISPATSYTNNHLIVQSTGNIQVGNSGGSFYWPGLVYLSNASSASNPTTLSTAGSITLGNTSGAALNNVVPAISTGGTGIFLETNNLVLNGGTVTTSNDSWVNFANATIASAFKVTQASSFYGAYVDNVTSTVTELGVKALPTSAFQPTN